MHACARPTHQTLLPTFPKTAIALLFSDVRWPSTSEPLTAAIWASRGRREAPWLRPQLRRATAHGARAAASTIARDEHDNHRCREHATGRRCWALGPTASASTHGPPLSDIRCSRPREPRRRARERRRARRAPATRTHHCGIFFWCVCALASPRRTGVGLLRAQRSSLPASTCPLRRRAPAFRVSLRRARSPLRIADPTPPCFTPGARCAGRLPLCRRGRSAHALHRRRPLRGHYVSALRVDTDDPLSPSSTDSFSGMHNHHRRHGDQPTLRCQERGATGGGQR